MRICAPLTCIAAIALLASCSRESSIERVREVPLKTADIPAYETGLHRAQSTYLLRGALTSEERQDRLGQYYFVTWYDAHPELPAELVMSYQQSSTGSKVLQKKIDYRPGRSGGTRKDVFQFTGKEHQQNGQILTWRVDLKIDGKTAATRRSYLWRDDHTTATYTGDRTAASTSAAADRP